MDYHREKRKIKRSDAAYSGCGDGVRGGFGIATVTQMTHY